MVEKLRVHYYPVLFSCNDPNYHELISVVHEFLLNYNTFTLCTTIEGALINKNTIDYSLAFLRKKKPCVINEFMKYWESLGGTDKVNVLRIVFNGNGDLLPRNRVLDLLPDEEKDIIAKSTIGDKASGWVSDYLDGFFQSVSQIDGVLSVKAFKKFVEDESQRRYIEKEFKRSFPELYSLIDALCDKIVIKQ